LGLSVPSLTRVRAQNTGAEGVFDENFRLAKQPAKTCGELEPAASSCLVDALGLAAFRMSD
jgi:hypothetical protein